MKQCCAKCHEGGVPAPFYTRVMNPEKNSFLLAPLAETAGGTGRCGEPVFASKDDPDYRKILATFGLAVLVFNAVQILCILVHLQNESHSLWQICLTGFPALMSICLL